MKTNQELLEQVVEALNHISLPRKDDDRFDMAISAAYALAAAKELQERLDNADHLLEMAVGALKRAAWYADRAEKICAENGYYDGDQLALSEIQEACPTLGVMRQCRKTLLTLQQHLGKE